MATNASSFSPMGSQAQYPQPLQQQQQPAENNGALPAYLQQNQNAANPTPNDIPGMPGMAAESKLGNDQGPQQISLPQQANTDSFTFNKKDAASPQAPAFGKKSAKDKEDDTKFGEDEDKKKEFAKAPATKSPFAAAPSFGEEEKKDKE